VPRQAVEHGIERDFCLQSRQGSTQAEVDAAPESYMTVGFALDIEAISIGELGLVAIRRADPGSDKLIGIDTLVTNGRFGRRNARHRLHRRVVAQGLLDSPWHQRPVVAQTLQDAGILIKTQNHIADQVRCGLITSDKQQATETKQFHVA